MTLKEKLTRIDPSKKCLEFLAERICDDGYRGMQISQHNRYTVEDIIILLEELYNVAGEGKMTIRNTDLSKRPFNTPEERNYAIYTSNVVSRMGRGTQDTIRKNHFVDLHRMGLLSRYDNKGVEYAIYDNTTRGVRYVSITREGLEIIKNKDNVFQRNFLYTKAIDQLSHGLANDLLSIVIELNDNKIDASEFMFFASFMGCKLKGHRYTRSEVTQFVKEYRSMSKHQKIEVDYTVRKYCNPDNFKGNKNSKRDYGNWKNETQQIFMLMDQTVLFEKGINGLEDILFLKIGKDSLYDDTKLKRSKRAKDEYFLKHGVTKRTGFELHHIIPLLMAHNKQEFDTLDVWENMVYIDGYTHGCISQTGNKNILLKFKNDDIVLEEVIKSPLVITCKKNINVEYNIDNQSPMLKFNEDILKSI